MLCGDYVFLLILTTILPRHTTSQELYPLNVVEKSTPSLGSSLKKHGDSARFEQLLAAEAEAEEAARDGMLEEEERAMDNDAMLWSTERVRKWLVESGLEDLYSKSTGCMSCMI